MLAPMLASLADAPLDDPQLVYEPKYDGIRAIVEIGAEGQRPPLVAARQREDAAVSRDRRRRSNSGRARRRQPLVLDGEIVALDAKGQPAGFQQLQGRIHLSEGAVPPGRTALIAFDILRDGHTDYRDRPLTERRAALERIFGAHRIAAAAHQRAGARRRPRAVPAGARAGLGRADRQARRLALQVGQAHARLAQAEDRPRTGVRHRRLDRAAADARVLRRAAARRLRQGREPRSTSATPAPASTRRSWRA